MDIEEAIARYFGKTANFRVEVRTIEDELTVLLYGPLDLAASPALQDFLIWIIDNQTGQPGLCVDLAQVDYISSTGVGALVNALTTASKHDLRFRICNLQAKTRSVFRLLGLLDYFEGASNNG